MSLRKISIVILLLLLCITGFILLFETNEQVADLDKGQETTAQTKDIPTHNDKPPIKTQNLDTSKNELRHSSPIIPTTLKVQLIDHQGQYIAGASIEPRFSEIRSIAEKTTSQNGNCEWEFPTLSEKTPEELELYIKLNKDFHFYWDGPFPTKLLQLTIPLTGQLYGNVKDEKGNLINEGDLDFDWETKQNLSGGSRITIHQGRYESGPILPTITSIDLEQHILMFSAMNLDKIFVKSGERKYQDLTFPLGPDLTLVLLDARTQKPVAGVIATTDYRQLEISDSSGRVNFSGCIQQEDSILLRFRHEEYIPIDKIIPPTIPPKDTKFTFYLEPGLTMQGTIIDQNGNPVDKASIELMHIERLGQHWTGTFFLKKTKTNKAGEFQIAGLPGGKDFDLQITKDERLGLYVFNLNKKTTTRQWTLYNPIEIKGIVLNEKGHPEARVLVDFQPPTILWGVNTKCNPLGQFKESRLFPGEWKIRAYGKGMSSETMTIQLTKNQTSVNNIYLTLKSASYLYTKPIVKTLTLNLLDSLSGNPVNTYGIIVFENLAEKISYDWGIDGKYDSYELAIPIEKLFDVYIQTQDYQTLTTRIGPFLGKEPENLTLKLVPK